MEPEVCHLGSSLADYGEDSRPIHGNVLYTRIVCRLKQRSLSPLSPRSLGFSGADNVSGTLPKVMRMQGGQEVLSVTVTNLGHY